MSHELDPIETGTTLTTESPIAVVEDRKGCELIAGEWVPKHPAEPLPDDDRDGCELINGEWVEKSMSNAAAIVESNLNYAVKAIVRANRSGFVFSESGMYQLFADQPKQWRRPDLSFVRFGRFPNDKVPTGKIQIAPDLAIEVTSPNDTAEDLETKLDEYLRAGVRLVWVLYIPTRNVRAYRPDGMAKLYRATDTLPGEDVLPGFAVPVADLFEGV
jgi:Uma2 family endonuclease